jgi:hypothetical protein
MQFDPDAISRQAISDYGGGSAAYKGIKNDTTNGTSREDTDFCHLFGHRREMRFGCRGSRYRPNGAAVPLPVWLSLHRLAAWD